MFKNNGNNGGVSRGGPGKNPWETNWPTAEQIKAMTQTQRNAFFAYCKKVKEEKIKREEEEKKREEAREASRQLGMAALERPKSAAVVSGNGTASIGMTWGQVKKHTVSLAEIIAEEENRKKQTGNGAAVEETEMATNVVSAVVPPVVVKHASVQVAPVNAAVKAVVNAGVIGMAAMLAAQGVVLGEGAVAAISAVVEANIKRDEPIVAAPVVAAPVVVEPVVVAPVVVEPVEKETNTDASVVTETVDENAVANAAIRIQALWRGYMQRKKPVDAPVVVEPVVAEPVVKKSWVEMNEDDSSDEESVAAPVVVKKSELDLFCEILAGQLAGTFRDMWTANDPEYPNVSRAMEVYINIAKMPLEELTAWFKRAAANTYHKIPRGEWERMGLTPENLKATCQAVCAAKDVDGRIKAFLAKAVEYGWANTSVKFSYNKGKEVKESPAFYAICVLYNAGKAGKAGEVKPKTNKPGFTPVNKANKTHVNTEKRGFVRKEKVKNNESTGAAAAAGTTTNSASAPVAQPVNVLTRTLRGDWFAVKRGDENMRMSPEQKAFEDALNALDSAATGLSLDMICTEYYLEGGSAQIKEAVNDFIGAKVNVVEPGFQYTGALIAYVMDKTENAGAVLVASEEELTDMLNGVKKAMEEEEMKKASA